MIRIHFCKSNDVGGWLIRLFTWSRWNHVAIEIRGVVFEALTGGGVRAVPAKGYGDGWAASHSIEIHPGQPSTLGDWLRGQVGKKYDWAALFSWPFRSRWQKANRWFCSELVAQALYLSGVLEVSEAAHRVTPEDLWRRLR